MATADLPIWHLEDERSLQVLEETMLLRGLTLYDAPTMERGGTVTLIRRYRSDHVEGTSLPIEVIVSQEADTRKSTRVGPLIFEVRVTTGLSVYRYMCSLYDSPVGYKLVFFSDIEGFTATTPLSSDVVEAYLAKATESAVQRAQTRADEENALARSHMQSAMCADYDERDLRAFQRASAGAREITQ